MLQVRVKNDVIFCNNFILYKWRLSMKKGWGLQNSRSRMIALFIVDMLTVVLDSYLAIILRFKLDNIWVPEEYMSSVEHYMIINVITTVIIFLLLNLYNRVWSYASLYEMLLIVCAAMLSTAFQAFGFSLLYLPIFVYSKMM